MRFIVILDINADVVEEELSFDEKVQIIECVLDSGSEATNIDIKAEILKEIDIKGEF